MYLLDVLQVGARQLDTETYTHVVLRKLVIFILIIAITGYYWVVSRLRNVWDFLAKIVGLCDVAGSLHGCQPFHGKFATFFGIMGIYRKSATQSQRLS